MPQLYVIYLKQDKNYILYGTVTKKSTILNVLPVGKLTEHKAYAHFNNTIKPTGEVLYTTSTGKLNKTQFKNYTFIPVLENPLNHLVELLKAFPEQQRHWRAILTKPHIFVDASYNEKENRGSVGLALYYKGKMYTLARRYRNKTTSVQLEKYALITGFALQTELKNQLGEVIPLYSDCTSAIQDLEKYSIKATHIKGKNNPSHRVANIALNKSNKSLNFVGEDGFSRWSTDYQHLAKLINKRMRKLRKLKKGVLNNVNH